jgi:hypothetical protein
MKLSLIDRVSRTSKHCPYLAIPIPGQRPFVVERKLFNTALRGITITDSSLEEITHPTEKRFATIWALTITHNNGRGHGRLVFYNLLQTRYRENYQYFRFKQDIAKWADRQRKQVKTAANPAHARIDKQIRALQREMSKIYVHRPINPLIPMHRESNDWQRERELRWHQQRTQRTALAKIAGDWLKDRVTSQTAYKQVRSAGCSLKTYSQVTYRDRCRCGMHCESDYWRNLYKIVLAQPYPVRKDIGRKPANLGEAMERHAKARLEYLSDHSQVISLREQIASLELLKQPVPVASAAGIEVI